MKCVKGQPHDHKHLMPTQIIPGSGKYKYILFAWYTKSYLLHNKETLK